MILNVEVVGAVLGCEMLNAHDKAEIIYLD